MKKNKKIAYILIIIGAIAITTGIILDNFILKDENSKNINAHQKEKVEPCKSIDYNEKASFVFTSYDIAAKDKKPILLTEIDDFYAEMNSFEISDDIESTLNFDTYDYLIYFKNDDKNCSRTKYLTNYTLNNNNLIIEFTNSEFNNSKCNQEVFYAYGIPLEKNKFNLETSTIDINNLEDPFKDCYK